MYKSGLDLTKRNVKFQFDPTAITSQRSQDIQETSQVEALVEYYDLRDGYINALHNRLAVKNCRPEFMR
jgi:hypothetical protein